MIINEHNFIDGNTIRILRERKHLTQKDLSERLNVSDKTISKWETNRGLPDITIIEKLAIELNVSVIELMNGKSIDNQNKQANLLKESFYVCPICGNVVRTIGETVVSCCGISLPTCECEESDFEHEIKIEDFDGKIYVSINHEMTKEHYISFLCYVTTDKEQFIKLYPEQSCEGIFVKSGHGFIYAYCNHHGLYKHRL